MVIKSTAFYMTQSMLLTTVDVPSNQPCEVARINQIMWYYIDYNQQAAQIK